MREFVGPRERLLKFVGLTVTVLMVAAAAACFVLGSPLLAIAGAIIGGWSAILTVQVIQAELIQAMREEPDAPEEEKT